MKKSQAAFPQVFAGGQTGADRASLDWTMANGIPHGGWCPKGRKAEDGRIPDDYRLQETASAHYRERTEKNVLDSDGTVVFTMSPKLGRGSQLTVKLAQKHGKPCLHIHCRTPQPALLLTSFIQGYLISRLNVAGSRASKEPGIGHFVQEVLTQAASFLANHGSQLHRPQG